MFVRLSGGVINTKYIIGIEPYDGIVLNTEGKPFKYTLYMVDGHRWYLTEEDNYKIAEKLKEQTNE